MAGGTVKAGDTGEERVRPWDKKDRGTEREKGDN